MRNIVKKWTESSLILKILIGLIIGAILGVLVPQWTIIGFPGELFVSALKAIAPILVLFWLLLLFQRQEAESVLDLKQLLFYIYSVLFYLLWLQLLEVQYFRLQFT